MRRVDTTVIADRESIGARIADVGWDIALLHALAVRPGIDIVFRLPGPEVPADGALAGGVGCVGGILGFEDGAEPGAFGLVVGRLRAGVGGDAGAEGPFAD